MWIPPASSGWTEEAAGRSCMSGCAPSCISSLNPVSRSTVSNCRMCARAARPRSPMTVNAAMICSLSGAGSEFSMASPSSACVITDSNVFNTSACMAVPMRLRSRLAASTFCRSCSALSASSRCMSTSAFEPRERLHRAIAMQAKPNSITTPPGIRPESTSSQRDIADSPLKGSSI